MRTLNVGNFKSRLHIIKGLQHAYIYIFFGNLQIYPLLPYELIIFPPIDVILISVCRVIVLKHRSTFTHYNYKMLH